MCLSIFAVFTNRSSFVCTKTFLCNNNIDIGPRLLEKHTISIDGIVFTKHVVTAVFENHKLKIKSTKLHSSGEGILKALKMFVV